MEGTYNTLASLVHENAKAHGWYDTEPSHASVIANIHGELSEAWEEYRKKHPMVWYACGLDEPGIVCIENECQVNCPSKGDKPEGIAVELADVAIRMLDIAAHRLDLDFDAALEIAGNIDDLTDRWLLDADSTAEVLPDLIARLQDLVCMAHRDTLPESIALYFARAIYLMDDYVQKHTLQPLEAFIRLKHAYNVNRPYRHGGKVC